MKEIQLLNVTRGGGNDTKNDYFYLEFGGQITGKIFAASDPKTGECGDAVPEVQRISSRTVDTTASGGDAAVSPRTTFRLGYGRETTGGTHVGSYIQSSSENGSPPYRCSSRIPPKAKSRVPYGPRPIAEHVSSRAAGPSLRAGRGLHISRSGSYAQTIAESICR